MNNIIVQQLINFINQLVFLSTFFEFYFGKIIF